MTVCHLASFPGHMKWVWEWGFVWLWHDSVCYQDKSHVQAPWTAGLLPNSRPCEQLFLPTLPSSLVPTLSSALLLFLSLLESSTPKCNIGSHDQVTWLHPIRFKKKISLITHHPVHQMIGSESSYGCSPSFSSSPREVTLWMGARHQRKEALQIFAREIAPAGTGMG